MHKQEKFAIVELIKSTSWHADWSGLFSLAEVSKSSHDYFNGLQEEFGQSFTYFLITYHNGVSSVYLPKKEYEKIGRYLGDKLENIAYAKNWAKEFILVADEIYKDINVSSHKFLEKLDSLGPIYQKYGAYNVATKMVFDVASNFLREDVKRLLEDARKYSETFYKDNSHKFSQVASLINKQVGYPKKYILMMTRDELIKYHETNKIPQLNILTKRYDGCGIYFFNDKV